MTLDAGSELGSQLRLVAEMAEGASGTIWRAAHLGLGADVAVKIMHLDAKVDALAALRFAEEARSAAQIRHPNILRIFDRGTTDEGAPYLVMELLEGESLQERLSRGPLSHEEAVHIVVQLTKGLEAAHGCDVVHRDLKPANVFLCDDDELPFVKILDFGVAKRLGEQALLMTTEGTLIGTLPYMSPEQLAGKSVDVRSDLWALGIVAYQMLAGCRPFTGDTLSELIVAVENGTFTPLGDLVAHMPRAVDDWMSRALQPDLSNRFQTAAETLQAWRDAWGIPATKHSLRPPASQDVDVGAPTVEDRSVELPTARDKRPTELDAATPSADEPPSDRTSGETTSRDTDAPAPSIEEPSSDDTLRDRDSSASRRRIAVLALAAAAAAGVWIYAARAGPALRLERLPIPENVIVSVAGGDTDGALAAPRGSSESSSTPSASAAPPDPEPQGTKPRPSSTATTSSSNSSDARTKAAGERLGI